MHSQVVQHCWHSWPEGHPATRQSSSARGSQELMSTHSQQLSFTMATAPSPQSGRSAKQIASSSEAHGVGRQPGTQSSQNSHEPWAQSLQKKLPGQSASVVQPAVVGHEPW